MITSLIAFAARIAFLAAFTFAFVVLFEYGPTGFVDGASKEWQTLTSFVQGTAKAP